MAGCFSLVSLYEKYLRRALSGAGLSSQTIDIDDQTTIQFWGPDPSTNPTHKPALVFINGFGPDALWQWRHQAVFFAPDFAVYVPNLVFFGQSTTRSPERSEIFQAGCVGKLLEIIGVKRYSVVGTSYGGFVAYRMASMWPERVEKVVIASSGVNLRHRDNVELLERAKVGSVEELLLPATAKQMRNLVELAVSRRAHYMPDFVFNDLISTLYSENRKEKMELLKGLTLGQDNTTKLSPLQQEVLIVWGEHDRIFLLEKAIELKELLGAKARLKVMKKAAHVPQIERPRYFNAIVKEFLCGAPQNLSAL